MRLGIVRVNKKIGIYKANESETKYTITRRWIG
jgi:hypothetical protein